MVLDLFIFCILYAVGLSTSLSHEINCSSTYDASKGMIILREEERGKTCVWKFTGDTGDTFVLEFIEFETLSQLYTLCEKTYLELCCFWDKQVEVLASPSGSVDGVGCVTKLNLCHIAVVIESIYLTCDLGCVFTIKSTIHTIKKDNSKFIYIKDGATEDSPLLIGPKLCYIIQSGAKIKTNTSGLWVKLVVDSFSYNVKLTAFVRIVSGRKYYKTYSHLMTWQESSNHCQSEGGRLGTNYPVPTVDLQQAVFTSSSPVWTGKSLTDWVWLLGCVKWDNTQGIQPAYHNSKYNQLSECATACKGAAFILVQDRSCFCLTDPTSLKKEEFSVCNITCPGKSSEKCGGVDTYTQYQFRSLPIDSDSDGIRNCVALTKSGDYVPQSCDILLPFSCSFLNSTETYLFTMTWYEAVDFCSNQSGSFGLSTIPQLSATLFDEPMWLALTRGIDWGFPSAVTRKPEMALVGAEGLLSYNHITYMEQLANASSSFQYVCEFDKPNCGSNLTSLDGNITSPSYHGMYNNNNYCLWTIYTDSKLVFIIEFESFDVEPSDSCIYDYLQFREVKDDIKILSKKYCGKTIPHSFVARTNHLDVMFKTDRSVASQGFVFTWKLVDEADAGEWEDRLKKGNQVNAGLVVGVTMATTFVVIIVSCVILLVYRRREIRMTVITEPQGSSVNNAIYGISGSEFDSNSLVNDNYREYENVPSPSKPNLKEKISYNFENVANAIAVGKDPSRACGSKTNLVEMGTEDNTADDVEVIVNITQDKDDDNRNSGLDKEISDQEVTEIDHGRDTSTSVNGDEYVLTGAENEKTNEGNDVYAKPYKKADRSSVRIYQNNTISDSTDKLGVSSSEKMYQNEGKPDNNETDVVIGNYNYIYFDNIDNTNDGYEKPIKSPVFDKNQDHEPLVPQVSNWYTEIEETRQLKK